MTQANYDPIQIYQAENGALEIHVDENNETIWLTREQISILFEKDRTVISRHIKNIFQEGELKQEEVCAFFALTTKHGAIKEKTQTKQVEFFNLDLILSIGYRTNSKQATKFRQWATSVLKDHLLKGYSLNKKLLETKREQIEEIRKTLDFLVKSGENLEASDLFLEILSRYTQSLITLSQFDEGRLEVGKGKQGVQVEIREFRDLIVKAKKELIGKQEATELFGQEYEGKFESSVATVYQSFGGQELYPSLEEKSANLFYLIVKNHGFVDGNKRIGSILFVYYLAKNKYLYRENGEIKINENTLVALALLIAQSKPEDKEIMIKLVIKLIQK